MESFTYIKNWKLSWIENATLIKKSLAITRVSNITECGLKVIDASVPGNFELDFMREGILDDVYEGANSVKTQRLENLHLYYFTEFDLNSKNDHDSVLTFEGIDTVAEIFIDGNKIAFVENMHHAHSFNINGLSDGRHELLVHILPVSIYARQFDIPSMCFGMKYNHDAIEVRKSASMFGWDIMPRIVSAGIWKPVKINYVKRARIKEPFVYLDRLLSNNEHAVVVACFKIESPDDLIFDYKVLVKGKCEDSEFSCEFTPYCASNKLTFGLDNPKLWWPKGYGKQYLYEIEFTLVRNGEEIDKATVTTGLRSVWLKRTSTAGKDGDFCFIVNGKRIFVTGTNWVPTDAFPSRHDDYTVRGLEFANDLGCNMIRCWGGNTYPSHLFYDYCDKHGIMVWQDFSFGCGHYPDDERLLGLVREEIKQTAINLRNHPSLVLWAGDNE